MGKHGPCYHCGVTSTPLWRNGPPDKPVLCNACGSRWRTKGTLVNYIPQHSRPEQPEKIEDYRVFKVKPVSIKNNPAKVLKRKINNDVVRHGAVIPLTDYYRQKSRKGFDENASNKSSSGSAISNNSESYLQYGSPDASDLTGPSSQQDVWEKMVPSKKRTCVTRSKPSSVEKLSKDLYTIWQEQQQSSCLSVCSEDELLFETDKPMVSVEIGHGSILIRHPHSVSPEEESEASSISIDHKLHTVNFHLAVSPDGNKQKCVGFLDGKNEKLKKPAYQGVEKEQISRDKDEHEKPLIFSHDGSPLCHIDLQDVINFDTFTNHLTNDEQQQLLKYLPSLDTLDGSLSVENMFDVPQFKDNMLSLQKLVVDGVFDNSLRGISTDDVRTLKKLVLCNSTKSKWVEKYQSIKDFKGNNSINESEAVRAFNSPANNHSESRYSQHQTGGKVKMNKIIEKISCNKDLTNKEGTFISSRSLFSSLNENSSFVEDHDLLLNVPCNSSFPQAELLILPTSSSSSVYPNLFCL